MYKIPYLLENILSRDTLTWKEYISILQVTKHYLTSKLLGDFVSGPAQHN